MCGGRIGVAQLDTHEKAVELRFGQRKGADLVRRILRGNDEEWFEQAAHFAFGSDLPFLHGFEQGALCLERGRWGLDRRRGRFWRGHGAGVLGVGEAEWNGKAMEQIIA